MSDASVNVRDEAQGLNAQIVDWTGAGTLAQLALTWQDA